SSSFFFTALSTYPLFPLSLHDALPISCTACRSCRSGAAPGCLRPARCSRRSPPRRAIQLPRRLQLRLPDSWRLRRPPRVRQPERSEEHTSELQSPDHLVCRLLLEKKKM